MAEDEVMGTEGEGVEETGAEAMPPEHTPGQTSSGDEADVANLDEDEDEDDDEAPAEEVA